MYCLHICGIWSRWSFFCPTGVASVVLITCKRIFSFSDNYRKVIGPEAVDSSCTTFPVGPLITYRQRVFQEFLTTWVAAGSCVTSGLVRPATDTAKAPYTTHSPQQQHGCLRGWNEDVSESAHCHCHIIQGGKVHSEQVVCPLIWSWALHLLPSVGNEFGLWCFCNQAHFLLE